MSSRSYRPPLEDIANSGVTSRPEYDQVAPLRAILQKFTKAQLRNEVLEISNLSQHFSPGDHARRLDKFQTVNYIINLAKRTNKDLADMINLLELKYCQIHTSSKVWYAIEIKNPGTYIEESTRPEKFTQKLVKHLKPSQYFCNVKSQFYNGAMWTKISIRKKEYREKKVFLLSYAGLPVVLHTHLTKCHKEIMSRILVQIFKGSGVSDVPLQSKNIHTLLLHCTEKFHMDFPYAEREERIPSDDQEEELLPNIVAEDKETEEKKRNYLSEIFSSCKELPFENLTCQVLSDFFAEHAAMSVTSHVVFRGKNILEGIHELVDNGVAKFPLPDFITPSAIRSIGNKITVKAKRPRTSDS